MKRSNAKMMSRPLACLLSLSPISPDHICPLPHLQEPTEDVKFTRLGTGARTRAPEPTVSESESEDADSKESKADQSNSAEKERGTTKKCNIWICVICILCFDRF